MLRVGFPALDRLQWPYIKPLIVLSLYRRPSDLSIAAIEEAQFMQFLVDVGVLPDAEYKAYLELNLRKAG